MRYYQICLLAWSILLELRIRIVDRDSASLMKMLLVKKEYSDHSSSGGEILDYYVEILFFLNM